MRIQLRPDRQSKLGYRFIDILVPNLEMEKKGDDIHYYHLCNTETGLTLIHSKELSADVENYRKDWEPHELAHVLRGGKL